MSSRMLTDEEFQKIADWLYTCATSILSIHNYDIRRFLCLTVKGEKDEETAQTVTDCIRNYYNLNRLALAVRYGERYDQNDAKEFTPKKDSGYLNERDVLRTMKSLTYQTAEYITSDTNLHKSLVNFIGTLCENRIFAD